MANHYRLYSGTMFDRPEEDQKEKPLRIIFLSVISNISLAVMKMKKVNMDNWGQICRNCLNYFEKFDLLNVVCPAEDKQCH